MIHGDQDPQVPIDQSHELAASIDSWASLPFEIIKGGEHGGKSFFDEQRQELMKIPERASADTVGRNKPPSVGAVALSPDHLLYT